MQHINETRANPLRSVNDKGGVVCRIRGKDVFFCAETANQLSLSCANTSALFMPLPLTYAKLNTAAVCTTAQVRQTNGG